MCTRPVELCLEFGGYARSTDLRGARATTAVCCRKSFWRIAVVAEQAAATALSVAAGRVITTDTAATFVDGVAGADEERRSAKGPPGRPDSRTLASQLIGRSAYRTSAASAADTVTLARAGLTWSALQLLVFLT